MRYLPQIKVINQDGSINLSKAMEWTGCVFGLLGAALLARCDDYSRWGFVSFLVSNAFLIAYAYLNRASGLGLMQLGFTATSTIGVYNGFIR